MWERSRMWYIHSPFHLAKGDESSLVESLTAHKGVLQPSRKRCKAAIRPGNGWCGLPHQIYPGPPPPMTRGGLRGSNLDRWGRIAEKSGWFGGAKSLHLRRSRVGKEEVLPPMTRSNLDRWEDCGEVGVVWRGETPPSRRSRAGKEEVPPPMTRSNLDRWEDCGEVGVV